MIGFVNVNPLEQLGELGGQVDEHGGGA